MENFRRFCCWRREPVYCPEGKGSAHWRRDFLAPCNLPQGFWLPTPGRWPTFLAPFPDGARPCLRARPSRGVQPGFGVAGRDTVPVPGGTVTLTVGALPRKLAPEWVPLAVAICMCPWPLAQHCWKRGLAPNNAGLGAPACSPGSQWVAGERFLRFSSISFPR